MDLYYRLYASKIMKQAVIMMMALENSPVYVNGSKLCNVHIINKSHIARCPVGTTLSIRPCGAAHARCSYALPSVVRVVNRTWANAFPNAFAPGPTISLCFPVLFKCVLGKRLCFS